jgi:hypothetical protein
VASVASKCNDPAVVTLRPKPARRPPEEIAAAGRIAGLTVGACLAVSGVAFVVASWDELTCTPAGAECDDIAGIGVAVSFVALAVAIAGIAIVALTARRPVLASGSSAWTWGLAVIFSIGTTLVAMRIPGHTCPDGVHLNPVFDICIDGARRFDATSWVWPKRALALAGVVAGFTLVRTPRQIWLSAPVAAIAWFAGTGWLLYDTMLTGLPR